MNIKKFDPSWWQEACNDISKNDPIMKKLIEKYSNNKLSSIRNPFFSLTKSIVGQQISVLAANAIWSRLENKYDILNGYVFKKADIKKLKEIGLSERKAIYIINLSEAMIGKNNYNYWKDLNNDEVFSTLIKVKGIGPWTIKMFLIFCLNRPDIFSVEDLGLLKAIGKNYLNGFTPDKNKAEHISSAWKPWRTLASWYLWRSIDPDIVLY